MAGPEQMEDREIVGTPGLERWSHPGDDYAKGLELSIGYKDGFSQTHVYPQASAASLSSICINSIHHERELEKPAPKSARICGIRRSRLWLFALLTALVIMTIVAASVSGALAAQQKRADNSTQ